MVTSFAAACDNKPKSEPEPEDPDGFSESDGDGGGGGGGGGGGAIYNRSERDAASTAPVEGKLKAGVSQGTTSAAAIKVVPATQTTPALSALAPTPTSTSTSAQQPQPSLAASVLSVSAASVSSGSALTLTLTVLDTKLNRYVSGGFAVAFAANGGSSTGTISNITDHHDGTYTASYTGIMAGTVQTFTATIDGQSLASAAPTASVNAGALSLAQSQVELSDSSVASGSSLTATVTARDAAGNSLGAGLNVVITATGGTSTGTVSPVTDNLNGTYSANFTGVLKGTAKTISATIGGNAVTSVFPTVAVTQGPLSVVNSKITVASATVLAGNTVLVKVTAKDDAGNQFAGGGAAVTIGSSGGGSSGSFDVVDDNGDGTYSSEFSAYVAGSATTVSATIGGASITSTAPSITVLPGAYDIGSSTLQVSSALVTSGSTSILTLITRDAYGNTLTSGGASVDFSLSGGASNGVISSVVDASNGTYTATFTGTTSGSSTSVIATIGGSALLSAFPAITVVTGPVSTTSSTVTASAATIQSGNSTQVRMTSKDINGNIVSGGGLAVTFTILGGASTGSFGVVTAAGDGTYTATFTAVASGTATTIHAQIAGAEVSSALPTLSVTPSSLVNYRIYSYPSPSQAGDEGDFSVQVEDHNHNIVTDYVGTIRFTSSDSLATLPANYTFNLSDAGVKAFKATLKSSGVHTLTGTDTISGALVGSQSSITVNAAPATSLAFVGPQSGKAIVCSPAISVNLQDPYGNLVNVTGADLAVSLGGAGSGDFYGDSSCTSLITSTSIVSGTSTSVIYIKDNTVEALTLTAADQGALFASASFSYAVKAYQAWLGGVAVANKFETGAFPSRGRMDGMLQGPIGAAFDSSNFMYVADSANSRIAKFDAANNYSFVGWVGKISVPPTGGDFGCSNTAVNLATPGWCTGGFATSGTGQGFLNAPQSIYINGINLYVVDSANHRIVRYDTSTGRQSGWIGKILTAPTGGASGCSGAAISTFTPGWCTGGTSISGTGDGHLSTPRAIIGDGTYLYVSDGANHRLSRYLMSTGAFAGWIGNIATAATGGDLGCNTAAVSTYTPGWCRGGTAKGGLGDGMFNTPRGLSLDQTYLYVADSLNNRMQKITAATGAVIGWIGTIRTPATGGSVGCTSTGIGRTTPGWCLGGTAKTGTADGQFAAVYASYISGGSLFTVDATAARVNKHDAATGAFSGWVGRVLTSPTGGALGCNGAAVNSLTPGWCIGGTSATGEVGGMLNGPQFIDGDGTYAYVSDTANNRMVRYNLATGVYNGWLGARGDSTGGWTIASPMSLLSGRDDQGFYSGTGLAVIGGDLFAADSSNHRLKRYAVATGSFSGWVGNIWTPPTGGGAGCSGAAISTFSPGWCVGGNAKTGTGNGMLNTPQGMYGDGSYLYVSDQSNHRISKYDAMAGTFLGWIGYVSTTPTSGASGCSSAAASTVTPGWCLGGTSKTGAVTGALNMPQGIDSDGTNLYVADGTNHRIVKYNKTTGAVIGWIGKIATSPTGGGAGCAGAVVGTFTPGWCTGGTAASGTGSGHLNTPRDMTVSNGNLYIADANHRVSRFTLSSGAFTGWIGKILTTPTSGDAGCAGAAVSSFTPGWCIGGTATNGTGNGQLNAPKGLWPNGTHLYVADVSNNRISKYSLTTGAFVGWFGAVSTVPTGGQSGCSSTPVGALTPGWCTGGTAKRGSDLGMFDAPAYVKGAGVDYLYITDGNNDRITRIPQ